MSTPAQDACLLCDQLDVLIQEPSVVCLCSVTEFSKKTGDYPSLSATDIKVLALTYQLELEQVGSHHLRKEPEVKVLLPHTCRQFAPHSPTLCLAGLLTSMSLLFQINIEGTQRHPETPVNVAGFHFPSKVEQL